MKRSLIKGLLFICFSCCLCACDRTEIVGTPWNTEQIPVVYSILAPGEPVQIYLNKTVNSNLVVEKSPYPEAKAFICGPDSNWIELIRLKAIPLYLPI